jgi:HD-GYP domain-containing protein (c-di-GMP phosphodiesterase class II)
LDLTELSHYFNTLKKIIGDDLSKYFEIYPEEIYDFINKIKLVKEKFLKENITRLNRIYHQIINAFSTIIEDKDQYTSFHQQRVAPFIKDS